jgi:hypothetical protein
MNVVAAYATAVLAVVAGCGNSASDVGDDGGSFECDGVVSLMEDGGAAFPSRDSLVDAYSSPGDVVAFTMTDGILHVIVSTAEGTSKARIEAFRTSTGWESGLIERC